jgi:hypothetical protein
VAIGLVAAVIVAFNVWPTPVGRLEVVVPDWALLDRDFDANVDLVLHAAGTADLKVLHFNQAELSWAGGRVELEALRISPRLEAGEVFAYPLRSCEAVWFPGDEQPAEFVLQASWLADVAGAQVQQQSWRVPLTLRR